MPDALLVTTLSISRLGTGTEYAGLHTHLFLVYAVTDQLLSSSIINTV